MDILNFLSELDWNWVCEKLIFTAICSFSAATGNFIWNHRRSILIWYKRQKLKFFPVNFNIALSIDSNGGLNSGNYFNQIKKNLLQTIDQSGLSNEIKIVDFSDIYKFSNKQEAQLFAKDKRINLIIWGNLSNDNLKNNGENIHKLNFNFTFIYPNDKENNLGRMIILDVSSKFAIKKYWEIFERNSFQDIEIISNNIIDLSLYIIALVLKVYGNIIKSKDLFENLYCSLQLRNDSFKNMIIPHLLNCYTLLIEDILLNNKNYSRCKDYCNKVLNFSKNNFFALTGLALSQYKLGEKEEAEKTVNLLYTVSPCDPVAELDMAFFKILQKKYSEAFKHYRRLLKHKIPNFNPIQTVEFLNEAYQHYKEPAFLYASGVISRRFGDKKLGDIDLKKFLKHANQFDYKFMYKNVKRLLKMK